MSSLEWIGAILGFLSVYLTVKQSLWCWPVGIVMVAIYTVVFFQSQLYADAVLQVIYFVLLFYGWYAWYFSGGATKNSLPVTSVKSKTLAVTIPLGFLGAFVLGYLLKRNTNQAFPYLDSGITVFSLVAQALQAKKKIENWFFWIGVNLVAIGVYYAKGLHPTAVLYFLFLLLAVMGYREWRKAPVHA